MRRFLSAVALLLLPVVALAQEEVFSDSAPEEVTLELAIIDYPQTLDPLFVTTAGDIDFATNLFVGLTRLDPVTQEIRPALAEAWEVSEDGLTWTFTLRDDITWVRYNAETEAFENVRPISAGDVLYSFRRLCSSRENGYYAVDVFAQKIAGCAEGQEKGDGTFVSAEAPDETTFVITLTGAYSYFLSMTPMWTIRPVPPEAVEAAGADWTQPDIILTTGPFGLVEASPEAGILLKKNPFYPSDLWNGGNITTIEIAIAADVFEQYARYRRSQIDRSDIPLRDLPGVQQNPDYEDDLHRIDEQIVYYFGFVMDKPPFDDVYVRRAFAAALDREQFIADLLQGNGTPMNHFTPSGLAHAPDLNADFDVGYDPDYARAQMAASAYPDCTDFPEVTMRVFEGAFKWAEFLVNSAAQTLGCDPAKFDYDEIRLDELQALIDPDKPASARPNLFTLGWGPDYGDADSFVTLLACGVENNFRRDCTDTDDLIQQARQESDQAKRTALYHTIEAAFFGEAGEFPLIPLYMSSVFRLRQPWFSGPFETDGQYGGIHYDAYTLDTAMLAEARIECDIVGLGSANLRTGPATTFEVAAKIAKGEVLAAVAQTKGRDGYIWWQLINNVWVRDDVVEEYGDCEKLPEAFGE